MSELKKIIEEAINGSIEHLNTSYDINESVEVYNDLVNFGAAYTINSNIAEICIKCKLRIAIDGIGWRIEE